MSCTTHDLDVLKTGILMFSISKSNIRMQILGWSRTADKRNYAKMCESKYSIFFGDDGISQTKQLFSQPKTNPFRAGGGLIASVYKCGFCQKNSSVKPFAFSSREVISAKSRKQINWISRKPNCSPTHDAYETWNIYAIFSLFTIRWAMHHVRVLPFDHTVHCVHMKYSPWYSRKICLACDTYEPRDPKHHVSAMVSHNMDCLHVYSDTNFTLWLLFFTTNVRILF